MKHMNRTNICLRYDNHSRMWNVAIKAINLMSRVKLGFLINLKFVKLTTKIFYE